MNLDPHLEALRELEHLSADASATRLKIRGTLERGHSARRHAGWFVALAVLLVTSASWALVTSLHHEPPRIEPTPIEVPVPTRDVPAPLPLPPPVVVVAPPVKSIAKPTVRAPALRYERAHDLYFHAKDYLAALAAWDDYLAAEPDGRFATEARYNRALTLVRLDRLEDAKAALAPFAHGDVLAGYRKDEAATLIEKIDRRLNGTK